RKLGVDHFLFGDVHWAGTGEDSNKVRINVELVRARDSRQLWSKTYNVAIDDIIDVQTDIARHVFEKMKVKPLPNEQEKLIAKDTENEEAHRLCLEGRYFWNKRSASAAKIALDYFQRAVDLDPGYSLAWDGIADIWMTKGWYSRLAPRDAFPKVKEAVMRALQFDSTLAEAHASLAHVHLEFD